MQRVRSIFLVMIAAAAMIGGCAGLRYGNTGEYDITGEFSSFSQELTVYIEGEQAVHGRLPLLGGPRTTEGLLGPAWPPVTGSYRDRPVVVECERQRHTNFPLCDVSVDGNYAGTLVFGPEGTASIGD